MNARLDSSPEGPSRRMRIQNVKSRRMEITDAGLVRIKNWKYQSGSVTPMENCCSWCCWTPLVNCLPMWLAPNAVTLIGLMFVILGCVLLVGFYVQDFYETAPWWVYILVGLGQFIYITLDNIDGKQARRTNSSSPLGHLFDHGCDSVSTVFIALTILSSCRFGFCGRGLIGMFIIQIPFWLAQWEDYHTHKLEVTLGGIIGVTEVGYLGAMLVAVSGIVGPEFWIIDLHQGTLPAWYCGNTGCAVTPRDVLLFVQCFTALLFVFKSLWGVARLAEDRYRAFGQLVPIALFVWLGFAWCTIPHPHPRLVLLSLGMVFTYLTNKMIVHAMARMEYSVFTGMTVLAPLPVLYVISRFKLLPGEYDILLGAYCCYSIFKVSMYIYHIIEEISQYLGIYCFHLAKRAGLSETLLEGAEPFTL